METIIGILFGGGILSTWFFFAIQRRIENKKELFKVLKEEYIMFSPYSGDQNNRRQEIQGNTEKEIIAFSTKELVGYDERRKNKWKRLDDHEIKHEKELIRRLNDYNKFKIYFIFG